MGMNTRDLNDYAPYFVIEGIFVEGAIEEISKPIKTEPIAPEALFDAVMKPGNDFEHEGVGALWIIYIIVMLGCLIFNEFYIAWAIVTFIFAMLRGEMLKK
jgi:hypothetical protein